MDEGQKRMLKTIAGIILACAGVNALAVAFSNGDNLRQALLIANSLYAIFLGLALMIGVLFD